MALPRLPAKPVMMSYSVTNTCWFLGSIISLCFVIFTITLQQPHAQDKCKPEISCELIENCNFGLVLSLSMYAWMKIGIVAFCLAIASLWKAKSRIDAAAGEEGRTASEDIKAHKAAVEEHDQATEAVKVATNGLKRANVQGLRKAEEEYQQSIKALSIAANKRDDANPARGMELVVWRKSTRAYYCASLVFLVCGVIFATISFFISFELEVGCMKNPGYYVLFVAPPIYIAYVALEFGYIGITHN